MVDQQVGSVGSFGWHQFGSLPLRRQLIVWLPAGPATRSYSYFLGFLCCRLQHPHGTHGHIPGSTSGSIIRDNSDRLADSTKWSADRTRSRVAKNKYETDDRMAIGVQTTTISVPNVCREDNHDDGCSSNTRISY